MANPYHLVIFLSVLHLESHTVYACDRLPTLQNGDAMTVTKIMLPTGMSHKGCVKKLRPQETLTNADF